MAIGLFYGVGIFLGIGIFFVGGFMTMSGAGWGAAYWLVSYEPELVKVITPEVMVLVSGAVLVFGVLILAEEVESFFHVGRYCTFVFGGYVVCQ